MTVKVELEVWSAERGKGIDDLLNAGGKPTVLSGVKVDEYLNKLLAPSPEPGATPEPDVQPQAVKGPAVFPYGLGRPKPFPLEALPGPLREVVQTVSDMVNCPIDFVGVAMLAASATAIGNSRQVELKETWRVGCRLYLAVVGDPGTRKSPMMKMLTPPLWKQEGVYAREYREAIKRFQIEKLDYEVKKKEYLRHGRPKTEKANRPAGRKKPFRTDEAEEDFLGAEE